MVDENKANLHLIRKIKSKYDYHTRENVNTYLNIYINNYIRNKSSTTFDYKNEFLREKSP